MKTLFFSCRAYEKKILASVSTYPHEWAYTETSLSIDTASMATGYSAVCLFTTDVASAEVLHMLYTLGIRYLTLRSAGYDHVDLSMAEKLGITVANVPSYSPHAIAEHALTLLLTLNRKIILGQQQMKRNNFSLDRLVGFNVFGKTVGIVGTGKIGAAFATIMHGMGCNLIGYDIKENIELIRQTNLNYTSLEELCKTSDVISIHCPLTKDTRHMFNKTLFGLMKKEVYLINTSRGAVVNSNDLLHALEKSTLGAVGLDVYENEKNIFFTDHKEEQPSDKLFQQLQLFPNVLVTGHQGFLTQEALREIANTTLLNLNDFLHPGNTRHNLISTT
jgi:D-lactate dehydrogenase